MSRGGYYLAHQPSDHINGLRHGSSLQDLISTSPAARPVQPKRINPSILAPSVVIANAGEQTGEKAMQPQIKDAFKSEPVPVREFNFSMLFRPGAYLVEIQPAQAEEILRSYNSTNRRKREGRVERYASSLTGGMWRVNGQTITFVSGGGLMDGQHRLEGCVKAGKALTTWIITGLDPKAFPTVDTGLVRGNADAADVDTLMSTGERDKYSSLQAAVRVWLYRYERGCMGSGRSPDNLQSLDIKERHPDLFGFVQAVASRRKLNALCGPGVIAFCFYLFARQDPDLAHAFFDALERGTSLMAGEPVFELRERLLKEKAKTTGRVHSHYTVALFFKAWNATRQGKSVRVLVWKPESEPFPQI